MLPCDDAFGLDSLPDPLPPSLSIPDWNPSALGLSSMLASPTSAAHPPSSHLLPSPTAAAEPGSPLAQDASPAVHSSDGSNPLAAANPPMAQDLTSPLPPTSPFVGMNPQAGGSPKGRRPLPSPAPRDPASMHWQRALQHAPRPAPRVKGERDSPAAALAHPITSLQQRQTPPAGAPSRRHHPSHAHRTSTLEGFNPFATADADERMRRGPAGHEPRRMDAPSPPLRLSLQQPTGRTLLQAQSGSPLQAQDGSPLQVQDGYPLLQGSSRGKPLKPAPEAEGWNPLTPEGGAQGRRFPRPARTPPTGHGSRVMSGCITAAAAAAHEELMGLPLVCGPRTRSISAPIVRQGPAILRSKLNNPHRGSSSGRPSGESRHTSPNPSAPFREPPYQSAGSRRTPPPMSMWLQDSPGGLLRGGVGAGGDSSGQDLTNPLGELDLSPTDFPLRESSSLSWGTVEAIAAGYVPALDGDS